MKLSEALRLIQRTAPEATPFAVLLACGGTPLHLQTYLHAHLQRALPQRRVTMAVGLFGDLHGTLAATSSNDQADKTCDAIAIALEWADLDPRLGYRSTGRWTPELGADIVGGLPAALERLASAIAGLPAGVPVALSMPTLPIPPIFHTVGWQAAQLELELDRMAADFAARVAQRAGLHVVNARRLQEISPMAQRFDLKSDLLTGFAYTQPHAEALGGTLARLLAPPAPKKGIITDLDDTLWNGIIGDAGPSGVSWDFSRHHHLHALYQNLLSSLAHQGILLAVASKNDLPVVEEAFGRDDMLLSASQVFPFEVHWNAKSGSVARILKTWNIGADSVIFVDDSPMELAEVAEAHPGIECVRFPTSDYAQGLALLQQLRDWCGKAKLSAEDALRLESIRSGAEFQKLAEEGVAASDDFLRGLGAKVSIQFFPPADDTRVLELVNKTNQFNLNGRRRTEADWLQAIQPQNGNVAGVVSYEDKFGPLGKIAVFQGRTVGSTLTMDTWVMSCRSFSRRVEHQCLRVLLDRFEVNEVHFDFTPTAKNGPTREFLESLAGAPAEGPLTISREAFARTCPELPHHVMVEGL
jgi:FkbH-like protein